MMVAQTRQGKASSRQLVCDIMCWTIGTGEQKEAALDSVSRVAATNDYFDVDYSVDILSTGRLVAIIFSMLTNFEK